MINTGCAYAELLTDESLDLALMNWRGKGHKIAFTNGVFDLFHVGHDFLLRQIRDRLPPKTKLIVAVNSDSSTRAIKPGRPVVKLEYRMKMLSAHRAVDAVISFDERTPLKLIKRILPNYLVKGGDYEKKRIVGDKIVLDLGGEVLVMQNFDEPLARTTELIQHCKQKKVK